MTASTLLLILVSVTLSAAAQISFKLGISSAPLIAGLAEALFTPGVMTGLALYGFGTLLWLSVLGRCGSFASLSVRGARLRPDRNSRSRTVQRRHQAATHSWNSSRHWRHCSRRTQLKRPDRPRRDDHYPLRGQIRPPCRSGPKPAMATGSAQLARHFQVSRERLCRLPA